jgi:hemolysin activation/secretion protein
MSISHPTLFRSVLTIFWSWLIASVLCSGWALAAQPIPDAGLLRQQIEQSRLMPLVTPTTAPRPAPLPIVSGTTLVVKTFRFSGNTRLSTAQLTTAVAPFLNLPLDFAQLQAATAAVAAVYRQAGWIVRAYLPQQEIENGVVTIEVIEAVLGQVRVDEKSVVRLSPDKAAAYITAVQPAGELLNTSAIDRGVLLLGDTLGTQVGATLQEGQSIGAADVVLSIAEKPWLSGEANWDNAGTRSTGEQRIASKLNFNSPRQYGDVLTGNILLSDGGSYGQIGYQLPVGYTGLHIGGNASSMRYRLVAPEFQALNASGSSSSIGLTSDYPLIRTRRQNLTVQFNYDYKSFHNAANLATTTQYTLATWSAGLNGNLVNERSSNAFSLVWTHGTANLNDSPNQQADALTSHVAGQFNKVRYSVQQMRNLNDVLTFYAALSGQWADKNLDSAEKFYLGGANGVRAYPASEGGGAEGQLLNLEIRRRLSDNIGLTGFYDWGNITVNAQNRFVGAPLLNHYSLQGVGATLSWQNLAGVSVKATLSHRLGNNPNPTLTGKDQDGTLYRNRLWLQAALPF